MNEKTKVYALLVGINDYPGAPLNGCVPDAERIAAYLHSRVDLDIQEANIRMLLDQQATRENIIDGFRSHLSQAGEGEVALFYFSGHGAQELADSSVWINELDGCLECIACYSPDRPSLMADKELRFLIHELTARSTNGLPHVLTIFDCCHSGDNTRSVATVAMADDGVREKRYQNAFPQRSWEEFIFADHIKASQFAVASMKELLPQGPHINLSAAQDKQPALEIGNEGLFTQKLLQVLKASGGQIDYLSLHSLVSNYIRFKYKQIPQLAVQGASTDLLYSGFLNQPVDFKGAHYGEVSYNMAKGWLLNMGQMHGLSEGDEVEIWVADEQSIKVPIEQSYASTAEVAIEWEDRQKLDKEQFYKASVPAYHSYPLHLYINDAVGDTSQLTSLTTEIESIKSPVQLVENEACAEYTLHLNYGMVFLTESFDPFRPVLQAVQLTDTSWLSRISSQVQQIAKWEIARKLHNSSVKLLRKPPLSIDVYQRKGGVMVPVETKNNEYFIDEIHWEADVEKYRGYIKISITNNFSRPLYFCMLELTERRESNVSVDSEDAYGLVEKAVMELQPGHSYDVFQHYDPEIPFRIEAETLRYNKPHSTTWFKFLVSTKDNIAYQHLIVPISRSALDLPKRNVDDWTTQMITLHLKNPRHNKIVESEVMSYFKEDTMAPFAAGLYFDTDALSSQLVLKPTIEPVLPGGEDRVAQKNFFWDTLLGAANTWAKNSRLVSFRKKVARYPSRPLMVSEGDSWFQHPTIMEIIDHLSLYYNIYSRGAAGDEMRNYLMTGDFQKSIEVIQGEYPNNPVLFFLISGGGNDILGAQFKGFIHPFDEVVTRKEGEECERFLNDRFYDEMDAIMELYEMVLRRVETAFPDIHVLTHGYDYVWPKAVGEKGMSWLGAPMTAAGITRPGDRKGITDYLIDEFNKRLMEVVSKFSNATHLDLRGSVKKYQWADEIHPDKEGYQNIALKYMALIDSKL
jgi:hypothetical protein